MHSMCVYACVCVRANGTSLANKELNFTTSGAHMNLFLHESMTHISTTSFILLCHILGCTFISVLSLLSGLYYQDGML